MNSAIDITSEQRKTLVDLVRHYIPGVAVWAYGSRVKWTARPNSDLDLVVFTAPAQNQLVSELKNALAESELPFLVDLHVWDEIPERFREIIRGEYVVIQKEMDEPISLFDLRIDGWDYTTLGEICAKGQGGVQTGPFGSQLHASDYVAEGIPSIMPQNIGDNRIIRDGIARITTEDAERLERYRVRTGDIVYSRRGDVERRALVRSEEDGWLCGTGCLRVRFGSSDVDSAFASFYLGDPRVRSWIVRHAQGATMPNLNTAILSALPFVVPPIEEQRAIAQILSALDDKIELDRKLNETLEAIARAIFKSWFVDFDPVRAKAEGREPDGMDAATAALFPCKFRDSELGEIPVGWKVKAIGDVSVSNRKSIGKDYAHPEIEYVDISSVEPGRITSTSVYSLAEAPSRAKRLVRDGDTIWSCVRPNRRSYAIILEPTDNLVVSTGFVTLTATEVPFSFLYLSVTTSQFVEYLTLRADGAAYPAVRPDTFESAKVTIPAKSIANRFHEIVEPILRTIAANDRQATTLADLRDTLLPRLIAGKLRVPEAEAMLTRV
jgi:type I restriction enzyme S subunit